MNGCEKLLLRALKTKTEKFILVDSEELDSGPVYYLINMLGDDFYAFFGKELLFVSDDLGETASFLNSYIEAVHKNDGH